MRADQVADAGGRFLPLDPDRLRVLEAEGFRARVIERSRYPSLPADVPAVDYSGWPISCRTDTQDALVEQSLTQCGNQVLNSAGNGYSTMREMGTLRAMAGVSGPYITRIVDGVLDDLVTSFPAISLVGPRAAGKTTTAVRRAGTVLRLDRPAVRTAVSADPDAMLRGLAEPVILDKQHSHPQRRSPEPEYLN